MKARKTTPAPGAAAAPHSRRSRRLPFAGDHVLPETPWPPAPRDRRVSVVIPVLNESARVEAVVQLALRSRCVGEVIVVDDGSIDSTPELARAAGARVFTSNFLGKGGSMEDGRDEARHETILYLDGDLAGMSDDLVDRVVGPVLHGEADFVKARFARRAGRVTVLTARPLLRTYFPELAHLDQPLGGIVAARKALLQRLRFENDYGVDVGLLIDASAMGARVAEVRSTQVTRSRKRARIGTDEPERLVAAIRQQREHRSR